MKIIFHFVSPNVDRFFKNENPRTISKFLLTNIFSGISMDHHPTSFFILENTQLGTFWVGQAKMILDENGYSLLPAVTQDKLIHKQLYKN